MKKNYELVYLIGSSKTPELAKKITDSLSSVLKRHKAEVLETQSWGRIKTAYKMNGEIAADYTLLYISCESTSINAMVKEIQLLQDIPLRFMISESSDAEFSKTKQFKGERSAPKGLEELEAKFVPQSRKSTQSKQSAETVQSTESESQTAENKE